MINKTLHCKEDIEAVKFIVSYNLLLNANDILRASYSLISWRKFISVITVAILISKHLTVSSERCSSKFSNYIFWLISLQ